MDLLLLLLIPVRTPAPADVLTVLSFCGNTEMGRLNVHEAARYSELRTLISHVTTVTQQNGSVQVGSTIAVDTPNW
jgi:hypothetical protein